MTYDKLYDSMHRIIARQTLRSFTVSDYPNIRQQRDKRKLHREVYRVGYPESFEERIVKTTDLELI